MLDGDKLEKDRWKTRRRMAIAAFIYLIAVVPLLAFLPDKIIDHVSPIALAVITVMGGIIMVYIGYATADDKWQRGND